MPIEDAAARLAALAAAMIEQRTSGVTLDLARLGLEQRARAAPAAGPAEAGGPRMILEPIVPTVLSVRRLPNADPALVRAYGGDPDAPRRARPRHVRSGRSDVRRARRGDQARAGRRDLREAASTPAPRTRAAGCRGEILGVIAAAEPEAIDAGARGAAALPRARRVLLRRRRQGHGHRVPARDRVARRVPVARGRASPSATPMAYLVAPPLEATIALDAALKAADVRAVRVQTPPTETNFACAWLTGDARCLRGRCGCVRRRGRGCRGASTFFERWLVELPPDAAGRRTDMKLQERCSRDRLDSARCRPRLHRRI